MEKTHDQYASALRVLRAEGQSWLERRDAMIREANSAGMSYRTIGNAVGLSQTGVQKIIKGDRVQDGQ